MIKLGFGAYKKHAPSKNRIPYLLIGQLYTSAALAAKKCTTCMEFALETELMAKIARCV